MTPCIVTIRNGKKRRRFFFPTGSFSIGTQMGDDLIFCHPAVAGGSIRIVDGKITHRPRDDGHDGKTPGVSNPRKISLGDSNIRITSLQLKFFLPPAVILGSLCLAGMIPARAVLSSRTHREPVIHPSKNTGPMMALGIRDARITAGLGEAEGGESMRGRMANVQSVLEDSMAGGMELSRCYLVVRSSIRDAADGNLGKSLESTRAALEDRMQALLRKALIKSRSLVASGQISGAREEMKRLRAWIPGKWVDGKRELDEAESMFD